MNTSQRPPSALSVFRFANNLTQAQLAAKAGVARETISRLERGASPHAATADALVRALGASRTSLFPATDTSTPKAGRVS